MATSREERNREKRIAARRELGNNIRGLRKQQGRTLADTAAEANISLSLLSQVERGRVHPSLDSLRDIADALGTTPFRLLATNSSLPNIVRKGAGTRLTSEDSPDYELLAPSSKGTFEVIRWTIQPGGSGSARIRAHGGEEATVLLSGVAHMELGDDEFELYPGDAVFFDAGVPHRATAIGDDPAVGISIISPPYF